MKYLTNLNNLKDLKFFIHRWAILKRSEKLNEHIVDLTSFDTSKITNCVGLITGLSNDVIIKISNKYR